MLHQRHLATGDFNGGLASWDLERLEMPVFAVSKAHSDMINCIDGAGGVTAMNGPPEIVTVRYCDLETQRNSLVDF